MKKTSYIVFYCGLALALVSTLAGMVSPGGRRADASRGADAADGARRDEKLAAHVLAFYRRLDDGEYDAIAPLVVEGRWSKSAAAREYHFAGILDEDEIKANMLADYGDKGWMIRFVTLELLSAERLPPGAALDKSMRREAEIIRYLEQLRGRPLTLALATLTGHVTGRCAIIDWERRVPLVELDGRWVFISRGSPADYEPVRREQWFTPVKF